MKLKLHIDSIAQKDIDKHKYCLSSFPKDIGESISDIVAEKIGLASITLDSVVSIQLTPREDKNDVELMIWYKEWQYA